MMSKKKKNAALYSQKGDFWYHEDEKKVRKKLERQNIEIQLLRNQLRNIR